MFLSLLRKSSSATKASDKCGNSTKEDKSHVSEAAASRFLFSFFYTHRLYPVGVFFWTADGFLSFSFVAGEPAEKDLPAGGAAPQWDAVEGWVGAEMQVQTGIQIKIYHPNNANSDGSADWQDVGYLRKIVTI